MIRSNVGNIATNAVNTMSISTTTAKRFLGKADTALNNLTEEEQAQYKDMQTDKLRSQIADYNETNEIKNAFENERKRILLKSSQAKNLEKKISNDIEYSSYFDRVKESKPLLDDLISKTTKNIK